MHRDWEKYDTAHVVFQPKQMTPEELLLGYDWLYRRLFSHASIWRRRPQAAAALATYLSGCYLYKRSNRLWHFLIKRRLVRQVWRPLVELTRLCHVAFRQRLQEVDEHSTGPAAVECSRTRTCRSLTGLDDGMEQRLRRPVMPLTVRFSIILIDCSFGAFGIIPL